MNPKNEVAREAEAPGARFGAPLRRAAGGEPCGRASGTLPGPTGWTRGASCDTPRRGGFSVLFFGGKRPGNHRPAGRVWPAVGPVAFTLIELLVVIGVIAILAGLTLAIMPSVIEKRGRSVATTHLHALLAAIQAYHADLNTYPPDNPTNAARPPLFYELTGTTPDNPDNPTAYRSPVTGENLPVSTLQAAFGRGGFLNSGLGESKVRDYYPSLRANQFAPDPAAPGVQYLVEPVKGPAGDFNPWHYNSSSPTNNPNSFDLWVLIQPTDKPIRIGN